LRGSLDGQQGATQLDSPDDEILLLRRIASGDQEAFEELFRRLAPFVLAYLIQMLRQRGLAEEVLQDVFLKVWKQAASYSPDRGSARAWLFTITRSKALDRLRHERSLGWGNDQRFEEREEESRWVAAPVGTARLEAAERRRELIAALKPLPVDQRVCLALALFKGLSHSEIAARLTAPLGTVKSRLRMGLMRVRQSFG
jgi:RNA polymerase sigma-70 factor (ECF subfamily)